MQFTVVGVRDEQGTLTVAGVFAGDVRPVDDEPGPDGAQRWCDSFDAVSVEEAETLAEAQCAEE